MIVGGRVKVAMAITAPTMFAHLLFLGSEDLPGQLLLESIQQR